MSALPDTPTLAEAGMPGLILDNMYGLYAPAGLPAAARDWLNQEVSNVMHLPEMRDKLAADGAEPAPRHTPAAFKASVNKQYDQWDQFIRTSGIRLE